MGVHSAPITSPVSGIDSDFDSGWGMTGKEKKEGLKHPLILTGFTKKNDLVMEGQVERGDMGSYYCLEQEGCHIERASQRKAFYIYPVNSIL